MNDWIHCKQGLPQPGRRIAIMCIDEHAYAVLDRHIEIKNTYATLDSDELLAEEEPHKVNARWRYYTEQTRNNEQVAQAPEIKVVFVRGNLVATFVWCIFISIWLLAGEPSLVDVLKHMVVK